MPRNIATLETESDLDTLLAHSRTAPVLIFKHSRSCGTSAYALEELTDHLGHAPEGVTYAMVTVQTHRALSDAIAARLGVRHHTPQVLLVQDGRVVWSATHHRITADALDQEVTRTLSGATAPHSN
jgi:thioredoxin 1